MQVIKVTLGLMLLSISAYFSLRFYGLSQQYVPYNHPLLLKKASPWIIAWGGDEASGASHSLKAIQSALKSSDIMLGVHVQMNSEGHFFAVPPSFEKSSSQKIHKQFRSMSDMDVEGLSVDGGSSPLSLERVLELSAGHPLFLWVGDNLENIDLRLQKIFKSRPKDDLDRIVIHSEFDVVNKSIKALFPEILFGTGVGQRIRLLMLSSIGLESLSPVEGDVLVSPMRQQGVHVVSPEMKKELTRRGKKLLLGPLESSQDEAAALKLGADGYITPYPFRLIEKLSKYK